MKKRLIIFLLMFTTAFAFNTINLEVCVQADSEIDETREYLINLENKDVSEIESKIKKKNNESDIEELKKGKIDFKKYYSDTAFLGDSITEFLSEAEILNKSNVFSKKGQTTQMMLDSIDKVSAMKPQNIVMLFGMNDVIAFSSADDFKESYRKLIDETKEKLPKANIYVQSPLPVMEKAVKTNKRLTNDNIKEFRSVVKEVCDEEDVTFVDITNLVQDQSYFEQDGIHFKYDFYNIWLKYLAQIIK
ncbi:GDSL-type esterase/lipase family protein [Clostridium sp. BJN0001]|uniref:SGNH/GDSL hydrolase family protein n=1 Tax=Clostridium sp. BJN0001 TaxID=2930219 RepID=UPI001FD13610|nr:GDSL-type esterase/lipase family protein [Clostridium sp. BJN0001]